ncbi:MAG TPA: hypothetical protein VG125_04250, partial [Pirellulales bacterium]|nr:hypothetical protein [Pirellulales bacterium]
FEIQNLQCWESFGEHLRHCAKRQALPDALAADAMALSDGMLSPADAGHLQLRSYVHTFAHVPQHRGCSLKKETVEYLDKTCPEVVRSLPGYVAPPKPVRQMYAYAGPRDPKHSPRLYGLFDQTVFQEFHFLRVA